MSQHQTETPASGLRPISDDEIQAIYRAVREYYETGRVDHAELWSRKENLERYDRLSFYAAEGFDGMPTRNIMCGIVMHARPGREPSREVRFAIGPELRDAYSWEHFKSTHVAPAMHWLHDSLIERLERK